MSGRLRICGAAWTGSGPVRNAVIDIEDGRIAALHHGTAQRQPDAIILPADALIIPGLHDAHVHLLPGGLQLDQCDFSAAGTREEFAELLRAELDRRELAPERWLLGCRLDETRVEITRRDIDLLCDAAPVFIWSHDLHSAVVNTRALVRAGIAEAAADPPGGRFERDASGRLTGVLRETAAQQVQRAIPPPTPQEAAQALERSQEYAFSLGITAVSSSVRADHIPHYLAFAESPACRLRLNIWRVSPDFDFPADRFQRQHSSQRRMATLKGFTDGALGSRSAAFWRPYADDPGNCGIGLVETEPLARFLRAAHREEFQVALHAIGDRANSVCLDAIAMAGSDGAGPEMRPRIEHAQHLRPQDVCRFAELGVIASMQPVHCVADARFVEARLGAERARMSYAWHNLLQSGAALAFGSDWPVENLNPLAGIQAAATRASDAEAGWQTQECISVADALTAYTQGSAYAAFWEKTTGRLVQGQAADLTVLSKNIFEIAPRAIAKCKTLLTIAGGKIVYQA